MMTILLSFIFLVGACTEKKEPDYALLFTLFEEDLSGFEKLLKNAANPNALFGRTIVHKTICANFESAL